MQNHNIPSRSWSSLQLELCRSVTFRALWILTFGFLLLLSAFGLQAQNVGSLSDGPCEDETEFEPRYFGLWRDQPGDDYWQVFNSWDALQIAQQQGTRSLVDIETYVEDENRYYAGLWRSEDGFGGEELTNDLGWGAFLASQADKESEGYGLVELEVMSHQEDVRFLAVWRMGALPVDLVLENSVTTFETEASSKGMGQFLIELETWLAADTRWYLGAFRTRLRGEGQQIVQVSQSWCTFHDNFHGLESSHRLEDFEFYQNAAGKRRYAAAWTAASGGDHLWIGYLKRAFEKADQKVVQEAAGLLLYDFEIVDDGSVWNETGLLANTHERIVSLEQDGLGADLNIGGVTTEESDDGTIVGAPPLHDTGSSGPD